MVWLNEMCKQSKTFTKAKYVGNDTVGFRNSAITGMNESLVQLLMGRRSTHVAFFA